MHGGDKFASRSRKCIFIGYPYGKKGWSLYDLNSGELFVSRDVVLKEHVFPYVNKGTSEQGKTKNNKLDSLVAEEEIMRGAAVSENLDMEHHSRMPNQEDQEGSRNICSKGGANEIMDDEQSEIVLGRGCRQRQPSTRLRDYVLHTVQRLSSSSSPFARSLGHTHSSGSPYRITHYVNYDKFSLRHRAFLAAVTAGTEPSSFTEAVEDEKWRDAMKKEIQALEDNETWTVESLPPGKRAINCKWVYKIKYNADGTIKRYKTRLVILGNKQVAGIDYNETFAPVAKTVTVRALLAVAAAKHWDFIKWTCIMRSYTAIWKKRCTCKSLYGLQQAPRCWFAKLVTALKSYGFEQSYSDSSLFTLSQGKVQINVLVYVDDIVVTGNDHAAIKVFKEYLSKCFHMRDLGMLKYFLGIEVARSPTGIFLCQRKYALDIISEVGLLGAKPASFPLEHNHNLALADGVFLSKPESYRRLVGRLIYLSVTRPELSYSVHVLAQFMQQPREEHWAAALRVVRYLKGNPDQGIMLRSDCDLQLSAWCDSDWASCPLTRRSLTGWFILLGNSPVSWKTKKQHTVSRSSAEAEYRSMAATTCELKWLKEILLTLGLEHPNPMKLYCDNQAALHIAANPVFHERTKHIEIDCHFVRDEVRFGNIQPAYVSTHAQLADIFTKALGRQRFEFFLRKLGIQDLHAPT
ncbi:hypothetical protein WN943_019498 [Citrus x changshan-huyou]